MAAVTTKTANVHGDELIVTTTSPYEQVCVLLVLCQHAASLVCLMLQKFCMSIVTTT